MNGSNFTFKENHVFIEEEENPSNKAVTVEEERDSIDISGTGNLWYWKMNLPRLLLIEDECENVNVVVDGG